MAINFKAIFSEMFLVLSLFVYFGLILSALETVLSSPSWMDITIWIAFGKTAVQDAVVVLMGIVSYVTKKIVQAQNDTTNQTTVTQLTDANTKLQTISNVYLKMQIAALNSTDPAMRTACSNGALDLINAGVSLFNITIPNGDGSTDNA